MPVQAFNCLIYEDKEKISECLSIHVPTLVYSMIIHITESTHSILFRHILIYFVGTP
jgi:hypothetical protein